MRESNASPWGPFLADRGGRENAAGALSCGRFNGPAKALKAFDKIPPGYGTLTIRCGERLGPRGGF